MSLILFPDKSSFLICWNEINFKTDYMLGNYISIGSIELVFVSENFR